MTEETEKREKITFRKVVYNKRLMTIMGIIYGLLGVVFMIVAFIFQAIGMVEIYNAYLLWGIALIGYAIVSGVWVTLGIDVSENEKAKA